jgi:hypothetical protein
VRRSAILDHLADALGNPTKPFSATDAALNVMTFLRIVIPLQVIVGA